MKIGSGQALLYATRRLAEQARRIELLAFLPALTLAAYWLGGDAMLLLVALALPACFGIIGAFGPARREPVVSTTDGTTGLALRGAVVDRLDHVLRAAPLTGRTTCCLVVQIDDLAEIGDRYGHAATALVLRRTADRIAGTLREADLIARLDGASFAVALGPIRRADLESMVQLAARMQDAVAAPIGHEATALYVTASVGFCLAARAPEPAGLAMLEAAEVAAIEARRSGPDGVSAYTIELHAARVARTELRAEIEDALETGQICAYFQPQVSTDTGAVTGFEALARWHHPTRGVILPGVFLEPLQAAGLADRLNEVMVREALLALGAWDRAGFFVPAVAVNFSPDELRNPRLADRVKWELDRYEIASERLVVEILETVAADSTHGTILRNIAALAKMGCGVDLDDFGTGHASIGNVRRFNVRRIKIDRSIVTSLDKDRSQQRMVAAILSMAEQLGIETVAEGVETVGEQAMLAQLGCGHVQGYGLSRPMRFDATLDWMLDRATALTETPRLATRLGGA